MVLELDTNMWKNRLDPTSHHIQSQWIKDINVRVQKIKLLEKSIGVNLYDIYDYIWLAKDFL